VHLWLISFFNRIVPAEGLTKNWKGALMGVRKKSGGGPRALSKTPSVLEYVGPLALSRGGRFYQFCHTLNPPIAVSPQFYGPLNANWYESNARLAAKARRFIAPLPDPARLKFYRKNASLMIFTS
jgi:hypothetical protein